MKKSKRLLATVAAMAIVLSCIHLTAFSASLPSSLPGGSYTIEDNGSGGYILTDDNDSANAYEMDATSEITVSGDLMITLDTGVDAAIKSISATGDLTVAGGGSLKAINGDSDGMAIHISGDITVHDSAVLCGESDRYGVYAGGDIRVSDGGALSGLSTSVVKLTGFGSTQKLYVGLYAVGRIYALDGGNIYGETGASAEFSSRNIPAVYGGNGIEIDGGSLEGKNTCDTGHAYGVFVSEGTIVVTGGGLLTAYGTCGIYSNMSGFSEITGEWDAVTVYVGDSTGHGIITAVGAGGNSALYTTGSLQAEDARSLISGDGGIYVNGNIIVSAASVAGRQVEKDGSGVYAEYAINVSDGGSIVGEASFTASNPNIVYGAMAGVQANWNITVTGDGSSVVGVSNGTDSGGALGVGVMSYRGVITAADGGILEGSGNRAGVNVGIVFWNIAGESMGQSGSIVVDGGTITGTGTADGAYGVYAYIGDEEDGGESHIVAKEGELIGICLYENGEGIVSDGDITASGGTLIGKGSVYGIRAVEGIEACGGEIYGYSPNIAVYTELGYIEAGDSGGIYGYAPYIAVYTESGDIRADGAASIVKGTADDRDNSASVMTASGTVSAINGGAIYEYYEAPQEAFDNMAAAVPYPGGVNLNTALNYYLSNYTWSNGVRVSGDGLVTTSGTDTGLDRLTGTRSVNVAGEIVNVEDGSFHTIDIPVILSYTPTGGTVTPTTYTVTYSPNGGTGSYRDTGISANASYSVKDQSATGITRDGYTFNGWNTRTDGTGTAYSAGGTFKVTGNITLYAQWEEDVETGGETYTVVYDPNGGTGTAYSVTENVGGAHTVLSNRDANLAFARSRYTFRGWSTDPDATFATYFGTGIEEIGQAAAEGDSIFLYAVWSRLYIPGGSGDPDVEIDDDDVPLGSLDLSNHFAYIIGYTDGTVQPERNINRAEVATIFFRLLTQESREELWSQTNSFPDVKSSAWHNNAISTLANAHILKGRSGGTFQPNDTITRAEFAAIAVRFATEEDLANATGTAAFSDISGHWAEDYIALAGALGYVQGYSDGTFRPDAPITRAEVAMLLNNALNRHVESEDDMDAKMIIWPDNQAGTWYYYEIQEATNSHYHDRKDDGIHEFWTELRSAPDWAALEKIDAKPEDVRY